MKNASQKISIAHAVMTSRLTPQEAIEANHAVVSRIIPDDFDSGGDAFFLRKEVSQILSDSESRALDEAIERHGLKNILLAIVQLLESRVDASHLVNGRLLHHLAREDDYSHAAERLLGLTYDARIGKL